MAAIKRLLSNGILKNIMMVLSGDALATGLSLICLSLLIHAIGLEQNGVLIMVQTYCLLFNDIFNFQSFNAIIKYLPYEINNGNYKKIKEYIYQAFVLDVVTAMIASLFGFFCAPLVAKFMNWDYSIVTYIRVYLITVLFNLQGTPIGILRIYEKFNLVSYINVITSMIKLISYIFCVIYKMGLGSFLIVEIVGETIKNILMLLVAYKVLKAQGLGGFYKEKFKFDKEFFKFNFYINIIVTLDLPIGHISTFIINRYLGFSDNSIYKVFQKIGGVLQKVSTPISQVIYPEFCKMVSKNKKKEAIKLCKKMGVYIFGVGFLSILIVIATNKFWLWILIPEPNKYLSLLVLYLLVNVLIHSFLGLHSLFISLDFIKANVIIIVFCNFIYLIYFFILVNKFALAGVILSIAIQSSMVIILKIIVIERNREVCK